MPTSELPIFPLAIVLFPGAPQLLHIFEPRYRQMLDDCLVGDHRFGVSFAGRDAGPDPRPPAGHVGCSAIVQTTSKLADGRSNVLTMGEQRYAIRRYLDTDRLYLVAEVEPFGDIEDERSLDELAARVRAEFTQFAEAMHALSDRQMDPLELPDEPTDLSFLVAAGIDVDPETKHGILEMRSAWERLDTLGRLLRHLNRELVPRRAVHTRARRNGKGGHRPDIAPAT